MEIKIYIDVLLLINMAFNYLLLHITGLLLKTKASVLRLLIASFLGGLYAVCVFFLPSSLCYSLAGRLLVGGVMVLVAFKTMSFKQCVQHISLFYVTVLVLGGSAFSLFYFGRITPLTGLMEQNGSFYLNIPAYLLLLLCGACYLLMKSAFILVKRFSKIGRQIIPFVVEVGERKVRLRGFYDSGNLLCDKKQRGVIVATWQSLQGLFPHIAEPENIPRPMSEIGYCTLQGQAKLTVFMPDALYRVHKGGLVPLAPRNIGIIKTLYHQWDAILPQDFEGVDCENETNLVGEAF